MRIKFLGTGVAVHNSKKAQSGILIEDESRILVDCGIGTFLRLEQAGVDVRDLDAILITHNHLDHNGDLLAILKARWLLNSDKIEIYGPKGTKQFLNDLLNVYKYLDGKIKYEVFENDKFWINEFEIKTIKTFHSITSQAYVVNDKVVISGDTRAFKELMEVDCNVLIHELSLPFGYEAIDHTTPENLLENLKYCKAERIYLTHIYPMAYEIIDEIVGYLMQSGKEILIARDMDEFEV
ncbi:MBL fold metallo-hydrolase [Archaeoglobales archaeon]|nr:MAG: MBL fold metallo-hydrolase [Archaeoglobales archaeon]